MALEDGDDTKEASFVVVAAEEEGLFDEVAFQGASAIVAEDDGVIDGWREGLRA